MRTLLWFFGLFLFWYICATLSGCAVSVEAEPGIRQEQMTSVSLADKMALYRWWVEGSAYQVLGAACSTDDECLDAGLSACSPTLGCYLYCDPEYPRQAERCAELYGRCNADLACVPND